MLTSFILAAAVAASARPPAAAPLERAAIERVVARVVAGLAGMDKKPITTVAGKKFADYGVFGTIADRFLHPEVSGSRLDIEWRGNGQATAHLTLRAKEPFPTRWTIELAREDGRIVVGSLLPDEVVVARQMARASTDAERWCVLERRPDLVPREVIKALIEELASPAQAEAQEAALLFAYDWARQHGDRELQVRCPIYESTRALVADDPRLSVALAEEGVDEAEQFGEPDLRSLALFKLGIAEWRAGLTERAVEHLRASADLFSSLREPTIALKGEYMYAYVLQTNGDLRRSLEASQRLQRLSRSIGWTQGEILADGIVARAQFQLRNYNVAREYGLRVFEANARAGDEQEAATTLGWLGIDEMALGNRTAARDLLRKALRLMGTWYWSIAMSATLAHVLVQLGSLDEAEKVLDSADAVVTPDASMRSDTHLARSELRYAQKRYRGAAECARQAIAAASIPGHIEAYTVSWPAQTMLGSSLFAVGDLGAAEAAFRDAIGGVEAELGGTATDDLGRTRVYEDKVAPYRGLAELLILRGRTAEALTVAESIRARALREMIEQGKIDLDAVLTTAERTEKRRLENRLTERTRASIGAPPDAPARRELDRARLELEDFNAGAAVRHGRPLTTGTARPKDLVPADYLRPDEIAVEILLTDRETLIFLITRRDLQVRKLSVGGRRIAVLVRRLGRLLRQRDVKWLEASRAVFDAVIRPIASDLAPFTHICVIPDGDLWSIPFDVLADGRGGLLIEKATLSYAPSLLMLRDMRRRRHSDSRSLLALANPPNDARTMARVRSIERDAHLGALPEAEREVRELGRMYGSERSDVRVGAAARESLFKAEAKRYGVLHIATHAMVDDRSPMYSCLVLASDARDDGLLEMREIVNLDLHAELAVLSACDTARGHIAPGEGLVGIAWAFLAAGCSTTVVSEWKVDSAATERLMIDFHRRLIRSGFADKADALRRARLALMKEPQYQHPFYWAPFIIIGDS